MTGEEMKEARRVLGRMWGKGRPLHGSELGRALQMTGIDPGQSIRDYERGTTRISGPIATAVTMFLAGMLPPNGIP